MATPLPDQPTRFDYAIAGGGLQAALITLAVREASPGASIALVERGEHLGGNHTWCFNASDVSASARAWIEPALAHGWSGYDVRFPGTQRSIEDEYLCITPDTLEPAVERALAGPGNLLVRGAAVGSLAPEQLTLDTGEVFAARLVIDARGPAEGDLEDAGFQKFVGQELEFSEPHRIERPVLMDATVGQADGYRFFYLLPFAPDRLLVEDTRFTNDPGMDHDACRREITAYCDDAGWKITRVVREEQGVLPMPWSGDRLDRGVGVFRAGYRGGWFHPGTGYSMPVAARVAEAIAAADPDHIREHGLHELQHQHRRQVEYCQLLNRMLFRWYPPHMRWHIFARFYRMPISLIRRYYALRLRASDQIRLLVGRPPRGLSLRYRVASGGHA